jgi:lipoate-protein ligase A
MKFFDLTLPTLAENLALEEALLLEAEATGAESLRIWEWPAPAVVLGAGCRLAEDVFESRCRRDGVPIVRRSSGGGTVLLGAGCLVYSLVLRFDRALELGEVRPSYRYILDRLRTALAEVTGPLERAGISDLAQGGRKVSGSGQQRKRTHLLHHGTLLYDFDVAMVERYLALPTRQPDYRKGRPHADFLANVRATKDPLCRQLRAAWDASADRSAWPQSDVLRLVQEKYAQDEWTRRRERP